MHAMSGLGGVLAEGSPAEAAKWFQKAALLGEPIAMLNLGILHRDGRVPGEDCAPELARYWLERAAVLGEPKAMGELAKLLWDRDRPGAVLWFERAIEKGNTARPTISPSG
jgi:TPR repeat protein